MIPHPSPQPRPVSADRHNFGGKLLHWRYCLHCGLIRLSNRASEKAARKPCPRD